MSKSKSAGGGNTKSGRNREFCLRYLNEGRREINKRRKIVRHLKRHPADGQAREWLA